MTGVQTCALPILNAGASAIAPGAMDWIGLVLICFVLPAALALLFSEIMRKQGWIKEGDYKLV